MAATPAPATTRSPCRIGVTVHDLVFVLVITAVFGLLALVAKGAEKL